MLGKKIFFVLYPFYLVITVLFLLVIIYRCSILLKQFYLEEARDSLEKSFAMTAPALEKMFSRGVPPDALKDNREYDKLSLIIAGHDGRIISRTEKSLEPGYELSAAPRGVYSLRDGEVYYWDTYSTDPSDAKAFYAAPIKTADGQAILIMTESLQPLFSFLNRITLFMFISGVTLIMLTGLILYFVLWYLSRPVLEIEERARLISGGNLNVKIPVPESGIMKELASALNNMTEQLKGRLRDITNQKNERDAIFLNMREGVLAFDMEMRLINVNRAAAELLKISPDSRGHIIHEVIRHSGLQEFMEKIAGEKISLESEFVFYNGKETYVQARGTVLNDSEGAAIGVLVVLTDITQPRRFEDMRRDFVANVSHEIKTPVTAIKGSIETLLDGAIDSPDDLTKFMGIIAKHADRLNDLVKDILTLSSVERDAASAEFNPVMSRLIEVIKTAGSLCAEKAGNKNVKINIDCQDALCVPL